MATKRGIRMKINRDRTEALYQICLEMQDEFIPQNDHQTLLKAYLQDFMHQLKTMLCAPQQAYTLTLSGTASIAFYQLWHHLRICQDPYATLIVQALLKKLELCR